jgi:hypothetical protein
MPGAMPAQLELGLGWADRLAMISQPRPCARCWCAAAHGPNAATDAAAARIKLAKQYKQGGNAPIPTQPQNQQGPAWPSVQPLQQEAASAERRRQRFLAGQSKGLEAELPDEANAYLAMLNDAVSSMPAQPMIQSIMHGPTQAQDQEHLTQEQISEAGAARARAQGAVFRCARVGAGLG